MMKLKLISELYSMTGDQFFGHAKNVYRAATGGKIPDRKKQYNKKQAKYTEKSPDPSKICEKCIHYSKGNCKFVEGTINPQGVCQYFKVKI